MKKNLSKFIKPYTRSERGKLEAGQSIVVGGAGGVKI